MTNKRSTARTLNTDYSYPVPSGNWLYTFQEKAVEEMLTFLRNGEAHGVYNACEQGLGKSAMSIVVANELRAASILILCPKSVILNWVNEFKQWSNTPYEFLPVFGSKELKNIHRPAFSCVIISHDMAKTFKATSAIKQRTWDLIIIDEAHALKNRGSQRSKAILGHIWLKAKYRIALSATPITNTVADAFSLFSALAPSVFPNYHEFINLFSNIDRTPWGDKPVGIKNADTLKRIIRERFFVRYTKEEVGIDLPAKIFTKIILPEEYAYKVPATEKEILEAEVEAVCRSLKSGHKVPAVPTHIAGYRKMQALKRLPGVIEFVENLVEQEIPVVVFTWHSEVLQILANTFSSYIPAVISGETSTPQRQLAVERFQKGETNIFIGNIVAGGTGINLQRSSNVVFSELSWSPADVEQALSRCHRIGSKNNVNIYYFTIEKAIENRIINVLMNKVQLFNKLMERPNT